MEKKNPPRNLTRLTEIVIDTIKEITSTRQQAITPGLLEQALARRRDFLELLQAATAGGNKEAGARCTGRDNPCVAGRPGPNGGEPPAYVERKPDEDAIQRLRDFRISLLNESMDRLSEEHHQRASALLQAASDCSDPDQLLNMNPDILLILRVAFQKVGGEIQEFTRLFQEIGKNLVEMEADLLSSSTISHETYSGSRDFNNTLENSLKEISDSAQHARSLDHFKGFLVTRLDGIKVAVEQKRKVDELQLKKANKEILRLRQNVRRVKQELTRVSTEAQSLEKEVLLDPLTGIQNRRAYEKRVREELNQFLSQGQVFSMLLIDIDHFKQVNDQYGHWAGDRCLEEFTKLVKNALRGTDFLARYGGEEFVALLPGTGSEGIGTASERIRQIVERARFMCRDEELPITVSIGGTHSKAGDESPEMIFDRVDAAMYKAKQSGRNRVVLA